MTRPRKTIKPDKTKTRSGKTTKLTRQRQDQARQPDWTRSGKKTKLDKTKTRPDYYSRTLRR